MRNKELLLVDEEENRRYILVQEAQERYQIVSFGLRPPPALCNGSMGNKKPNNRIIAVRLARIPSRSTPKKPYPLAVIAASESFQNRISKPNVGPGTSRVPRQPLRKAHERIGMVEPATQTLLPTSSRLAAEETELQCSEGPTLPTKPKTAWVTSVLAHWRPQAQQLLTTALPKAAAQREAIRLRHLLDDHEMSPYSLWDRKHSGACPKPKISEEANLMRADAPDERQAPV
jgi:hypothetical protein